MRIHLHLKSTHFIWIYIAFSENIIARPAIVMPAMSPFLNEATVSRWRKKEGESFVAGEPIVQIVRKLSILLLPFRTGN